MCLLHGMADLLAALPPIEGLNSPFDFRVFRHDIMCKLQLFGAKMQPGSGKTYRGYLYFVSAVPVVGTEQWQPRVNIAKPNPNEPKDVQEQFFTGSLSSYDRSDDALSAADQLAVKLIDRVVPGLNI